MKTDHAKKGVTAFRGFLKRPKSAVLNNESDSNFLNKLSNQILDSQNTHCLLSIKNFSFFWAAIEESSEAANFLQDIVKLIGNKLSKINQVRIKFGKDVLASENAREAFFHRCVYNTLQLIRIFHHQMTHEDRIRKEAQQIILYIKADQILAGVPYLPQIVECLQKIYSFDKKQETDRGIVIECCTLASIESYHQIDSCSTPRQLSRFNFESKRNVQDRAAEYDELGPVKQLNRSVLMRRKVSTNSQPPARERISVQCCCPSKKDPNIEGSEEANASLSEGLLEGMNSSYQSALGNHRRAWRLPMKALPSQEVYEMFRAAPHQSDTSGGGMLFPAHFLRILARIAIGEEGFSGIPIEVVNLLGHAPKQLAVSPAFAASQASALLFLLRVCLVYRPTTNPSWIEQAIEKVRAFFLWPAPHSTLAKEVLLMLEKERHFPGTLLREVILKENPHLLKPVIETPRSLSPTPTHKATHQMQPTFANEQDITALPKPVNSNIGNRAFPKPPLPPNSSAPNSGHSTHSSSTEAWDSNNTSSRDLQIKPNKAKAPDKMFRTFRKRVTGFLRRSAEKNSAEPDQPDASETAWLRTRSSSEDVFLRGGEGSVLVLVGANSPLAQSYGSLLDPKTWCKEECFSLHETQSQSHPQHGRKLSNTSALPVVVGMEPGTSSNASEVLHSASDEEQEELPDSEHAFRVSLLTHLMECHFDISPPPLSITLPAPLSKPKVLPSPLSERVSAVKPLSQTNFEDDPLRLRCQPESRVGQWLMDALAAAQETLQEVFEDEEHSLIPEARLRRESLLSDLLAEISPGREFVPYRRHKLQRSNAKKSKQTADSQLLHRDARSTAESSLSLSDATSRENSVELLCFDEMNGTVNPTQSAKVITALHPPGDPSKLDSGGFSLKYTTMVPDIDFKFKKMKWPEQRGEHEVDCINYNIEILKSYLQSSMEIAEEISSLLPNIEPLHTKLVLFGGNDVVADFLVAYVKLIQEEPLFLSDQSRLNVYVVPDGDNMLARLLATMDRWYWREIYALFVGPLALAPSFALGGPPTEIGNFPMPLPMRLMRAALQAYVRHGSNVVPAVIFECRAWDFKPINEQSEISLASHQKEYREDPPDEVVPFMMTAEFGLLANIEFHKIKRKSSLSLLEVLNDAAFESMPLELGLSYSEIMLDGSESHIKTEEGSYANITLTNIPDLCQHPDFLMHGLKSRTAEMNTISTPSLMLHRRHAYGSLGDFMSTSRLRGKSCSISASKDWADSINRPESFLEPCHIRQIEIEALSSLENGQCQQIYGLVDGTIRGPFRKIQVKPLQLHGMQKNLTLDIVSFLPFF